MNEFLLAIKTVLDDVSVHHFGRGWSASGSKQVGVGVKIDVRSETYNNPEDAVNDLWSKVQNLNPAQARSLTR